MAHGRGQLFVDDLDDDERLTPEEVEEEIADIYEEFNERKALRQDAFEWRSGRRRAAPWGADRAE